MLHRSWREHNAAADDFLRRPDDVMYDDDGHGDRIAERLPSSCQDGDDVNVTPPFQMLRKPESQELELGSDAHCRAGFVFFLQHVVPGCFG